MKLLDVLAGITSDDLAEVNTALEKAQAEVDKLTEVKKIIELKLGLRKPQGYHLRGRGKRKPSDVSAETPERSAEESAPVRPQSGTVTEKYRLRAKEYLMANGVTKLAILAKKCDIPNGSITAVVKHQWFTSGDAGIGLGPAAYQS